MTGYLYQCELALLELARRSWDDATAELRMEVLDDIEILHAQTQAPLEFVQSKHREAAGPLSETGKDVWRSVASWIDALAALQDSSNGPMPILRLVTTQVAVEGTFLHMLRPGQGRDVAGALARMEEVAQAPDGPDITAKDRERFMALKPAQRYRLVDAIAVDDGAPLMSDLDSSLVKELAITPSAHAHQVLADIKGWWYDVAARLLERKDEQRRLASVSAGELLCRREEIIDRHADRNLPITEIMRNLTQAELAGYQDRLVVAQMQWIGMQDRDIVPYLRDFHLAWAQRSQWLRTFKISEDGLKQYERELWNEWDHVFRRRTRRLDADAGEKDRQDAGQDVLDDTMDKAAVMPARPGSITAAWIGRGTMHSLADRADQAEAEESVGWHPDYGHRCRRHDQTREQ